MIPTPDAVIDRFNRLGRYQPQLMAFSDCKRQHIRDGNVGITGVDGGENKVPLLQIDNKNDNLGNQEDQ